MNDKGILAIALTLALIAGGVLYFVIDQNRTDQLANSQLAASAATGQQLYGQYCSICHGPLGEGCIGPAINRAEWRDINVGGSKDADLVAAHDLIVKTIHQGRQGIQPNPQIPNMPAWGQDNGGPLNDQQIESLTAFLQHGDFNTTIYYIPSANLAGDLQVPPNSSMTITDTRPIKELMLAKGCLNCHLVGSVGGNVAANLTLVGGRRTADWMKRWIKDPQAMPAWERGPYLWAYTATLALSLYATPAPTITPGGGPTPTPSNIHMNPSFMPQIPMTEAELDTIVNYLSKLR